MADLVGTCPKGLTPERLREVLRYDKDTGIFTWAVKRGRMAAGMVAGRIGDAGYVLIQVDGRAYRAHRLAWLYIHGEWPAEQIDHVGGKRPDNRLDGLRPATNAQNHANMKLRRDSSSGFKGVSFRKDRGKWQAYICPNGKKINLGTFATPEAAHAAYTDAATHAFGDFSRAK